MNASPSSPFFHLYMKVEEFLLTRLVPLDKPGPFFKWLFKAPILHYRLGLGWMVGKLFLVLTTTGRKSGKLRRTPLEYSYDPATDTYVIVAGWGGKTDWFRNVSADPNVEVWVGRRRFKARAERLSDAEVAAWMARTIRINPASKAIWERWGGETITDSPEALLRVAAKFPSFRLKPLEDIK
ncbi:MAG: nitroreductase family deazaflavin-dependent oxidoreductase [Chloroflexota bacterium]